MTTGTWLLIFFGVALLVFLVVYVWVVAVRLDRLHRRVTKMQSNLELTLIKRAAAAVQLATGESLSPKEATRLLEPAKRALALVDGHLPGTRADLQLQPADSRYVVESSLTKSVRELLEDGADSLGENTLGDAQWSDLLELCYQLQVSRTVYNQDVTLVQDLRAKSIVRILHLAGFAPMPEYVDLDDTIR